MISGTTDKRIVTLLPLLLILAFTALLYSNTFDNELTYWDDNRYVTENPRVKDLSLSGIVDIFDPGDITRDKTITLTEYLPLTTLVHALAYRAGGLEPWGYHTANLLLYLIDIVVLYWFVSVLTGSGPLGLLAAMIFSVLTVHVESVAWVAATKDVLSLIFLLGSFILYINYTRSKDRRVFFYVCSLTVFALGLLAKSLIVTLPLLLMLYDLCYGERKLKVLDKVPYFVTGALLSALYFHVNKDFTETEFMTGTIGYFRLALLNLTVLTEYLGSFFAPVRLNVFYTYAPEAVPTGFFSPRVVFSFIVVAGLAGAGVYGYFKRARAVTFCVFWFFIAFLPVLNIMPSSTVRADRYLFIPSVGLCILMALAAKRLYDAGPALKKTVPVLLAAWLVFQSVLTYQRNNVWQNGITLWQDSIEKYSETPRPHFILGNEFRHRGMMPEAIREYEAALRLAPGHTLACANLGALYGMSGRLQEAADLLKGCVGTDPGGIMVRLNLVRALIGLGKNDEAARELREVLRLDPDNATALALSGRL